MEVHSLKNTNFNPLYISLYEIQHCLKGCILGNVFQTVYTWFVTKIYTMTDFARILSIPPLKKLNL